MGLYDHGPIGLLTPSPSNPYPQPVWPTPVYGSTQTVDTLVINTLRVGQSVPFADASGVLTLQNVDALDATTETTIEAAIDALPNVISLQGQALSLGGAFTASVATTISAFAATFLDDTSGPAVRATLGIGTGDSPQLAGLNLGHTADTLLSRLAAGRVAVAGNELAQYPTLASVSGGQGAALIGIQDAGSYFAGTTVESALQYLGGAVAALDQAVVLKGTWSAASGTFPGSGIAQAGWSYIVSVGGTVGGVDFVANDRIVALADNASTTVYANNWHKLDYTDQVLSVAGRTGAVTLTSADVTDSTADGRAMLTTTYASMRALLSLTALATATAAAGVLTFLATPSSANLAATVTDETGSGALVFANTPTLVTPNIDVATGTSVNLSSSATATAFIPTGSTIPTYGMYAPSVTSIGWAINSAEMARLNSSGLGIGVLPTVRLHTKSIAAGSGLNTFRQEQNNTVSGETHATQFATQDDNAGTVRTLYFAAGPLNAGTANQGRFDGVVENGSIFMWSIQSTAAIGGTTLGLFDRSGNTKVNISATATPNIALNGLQIIGTRNTGWSAMTGTSNKATVYDTSTVTLAQLAGRVMAMQAALTTHGLIGA